MHPVIQWCIEGFALAFAALHLLGFAARVSKVFRRPLLVLVNFIGYMSVPWLKFLYNIRQYLLR